MGKKNMNRKSVNEQCGNDEPYTGCKVQAGKELEVHAVLARYILNVSARSMSPYQPVNERCFCMNFFFGSPDISVVYFVLDIVSYK